MKILVVKGPCVYCCINNVNNKVYVGSSKNGYKRCHSHLKSLKGGAYQTVSPHWQASWNKYGEEAFEFFLIEECEGIKEVLVSREQHWIDELHANDNRFGYNIRKVAHSNLGLKASEQTKQKHREAGAKMAADPNFIEKMKVVNKEINNRPEVKVKLSKAFKETWKSEEFKAKHAAMLEERNKDPEKRNRFGNLVSELWKNPEWRVQQIAYRKQKKLERKQRLANAIPTVAPPVKVVSFGRKKTVEETKQQ
jgi:group I intron endonuclease